MKSPQDQVLVFTGLDGALIDPDPDRLQEILPALELMRSHSIPFIGTTVRTAAEVLPTLHSLDLSDPFIIEQGAAIWIPEDCLKTNFSFQKQIDSYRVVELGMDHATLLAKLAQLRQDHGFTVQGFSEISAEQASSMVGITSEQVRAAQTREYSEPIIFEGDEDAFQAFCREIEKINLRLARLEHHYLLTGDHDEGSAVRLLTQLYREGLASGTVTTIGLGDTFLNSAMLYTVDLPVLVRRADGSFDEQVGRRGLKFTRNPGPTGWSQAVIALITEDPEA